MNGLLEVRDLTGGYGPLLVLRDVSLSAQPGQLVVLAGPNGAGKTTLLLHLVGSLLPVNGEIRLDGEDLTGLNLRDRMRRGIALVPEGRGLFPSLTVLENLRVAGTAMGLGSRGTTEAIEHAAEIFPIIGNRIEQRVRELSGGEQQMVALGRGLMADPRVLLLDEPSMGLAPIVWREALESCRRLADQGRIVLLAEQRVFDAIAIADTCAVLQQGRVVRDGPATTDLVDDPELLRDYFTVRHE
jgi:branched-chain amino acid transport system ATP-binding protein